jgi:hypothetical protein
MKRGNEPIVPTGTSSQPWIRGGPMSQWYKWQLNLRLTGTSAGAADLGTGADTDMWVQRTWQVRPVRHGATGCRADVPMTANEPGKSDRRLSSGLGRRADTNGVGANEPGVLLVRRAAVVDWVQ